MGHAFLAQIQEAIENVKDDAAELSLRERYLAFEPVIKAALVTEFCNDVAVPLWEQCFKEVEYIRVVHHLQDFDFFENERF